MAARRSNYVAGKQGDGGKPKPAAAPKSGRGSQHGAMSLGHAARHEAPDQDLTVVSDGPDHCAPCAVRFGDHRIVGNIDPVVLQPDPIMSFL